MVTQEQHDLRYEVIRSGGRYSGVVDALVVLTNYRVELPAGEVREALGAVHAVLSGKADEMRVELEAAVERLDASYRSSQP